MFDRFKKQITFICLLLIMAMGFASLPLSYGSALQLQDRSLALLSTIPSATTTYTISFTLPDVSVVGSMEFLFCTTGLPELPCNAPAGLDVSNAVLAQQVGETGFSIATATTNEILLSRSPVATGEEAVQYEFTNITNPSATGASFYGRIQTFASDDGTGGYTDYGTVVSATTQVININTIVPPLLDFCVGQTVAADCSSTNGDFIDLGGLSSTSTDLATSQMAVGTNATNGVAITVSGATMTSGNNTIAPLITASASAKGLNQFGLNLRANSQPNVGSDPTGPGTITPVYDYDQPNRFLFNSGDVVASSPGVTDFVTFTASYIVNVSPNQPVGIYNTTLTYICTAAF